MTGIGTQIKNALGWFLTRLKGNVVNNLTSTSTDLPLSAAKGKDLQDQITSLNTNSVQNPRLLDNLYGKTWQEIIDSVTSWQYCGYGFKGWNDPVPPPNGNSYILYSRSNIMAFSDAGTIHIYTRDNPNWKKIF